jgi:cation:H+ antiporter
MTTGLAFLMLFGGCTYLLIGGDFLVRGALSLAHRTSVSPMVVGLTVVAMGTSAPELIVSLRSALEGYPGIAIGNVVGSNIANVLLVVGVPALIQPIIPSSAEVGRQTVFMVTVSIMFIAMCFAGFIGQLDGWLLLGVMAAGVVLTVRGHYSMPGIDLDEVVEQKELVIGLPRGWWGITVLIVLGVVFLPVGADLAVAGAVQVAAALGVSEAAIGSTMIALGTSLPELSSTIVAAFRRSAGLALGNVIGSNVINILVIMGITASIVDVPVPDGYLSFDVWVMLACALLLSVYVIRQQAVGRRSGVVFCAGYGLYCWVVL